MFLLVIKPVSSVGTHSGYRLYLCFGNEPLDRERAEMLDSDTELNAIFHQPRSHEGIGLALWLDVWTWLMNADQSWLLGLHGMRPWKSIWPCLDYNLGVFLKCVEKCQSKLLKRCMFLTHKLTQYMKCYISRSEIIDLESSGDDGIRDTKIICSAIPRGTPESQTRDLGVPDGSANLQVSLQL